MSTNKVQVKRMDDECEGETAVAEQPDYLKIPEVSGGSGWAAPPSTG